MTAAPSLPQTSEHAIAWLSTPRLAPRPIGLTSEEKERRRATLGSSEIAAVVGCNPYATSHTVYMSKVHGIDFEGNEATLLGNLLEPAIFGIYSDRYGRLLKRGAYTLGPEPWMSCTPDAIDITEGDTPDAPLVEAKLVGLRSIWMWGPGNTDEATSDQVPMHYLVQAHWQRIIRRAPYVDIAALLGTEFRSYRIHPNARLEEMLVEKCRTFWTDHVVTKTPPPVDGSESARTMLQQLYPRDGAEPIEATEEIETLARQLREARADLDSAEERKRLFENQMKELLKDARGAVGKDWRVRWAATKKGNRPFYFESDDDSGA